MKKTLLFTAVALMAAPAMASKARLQALNNAAHLEDVQDVFANASKLSQHGDWLTFEMGAAGTGTPATQPAPAATTPNGPYTFAAPNAEGGFARGMGDAKYGFYLGHHSTWVAEARQPNSYATGTSYLTDENPINLFYSAKTGDLAWGLGLNYAASDVKSGATARKQSATGINAGVTGHNWDAAVNLGLQNSFKATTNATGADVVDFKGNTAIGVNGTYTMGTMTFSGLVSMNGGKDDVAASNYDATSTRYNVGVVNSHKAEGSDFFYGVNYDSYEFKNKATGKKYTATQLPVFAGIEADATSWMVLRTSVSQNFLLGTVKDEINSTGDSDTVANNTTVNAGLGLKFGKLQLDGTFSKASGATANGSLNGNDFISNASLTYLF